MGLFDKKNCDICGDKIGLLGNRKLDNGNWEVGVHIADVTYYVKPESLIDSPRGLKKHATVQ